MVEGLADAAFKLPVDVFASNVCCGCDGFAAGLPTARSYTR